MKRYIWLSIFAVLLGFPVFAHHGTTGYDTSKLVVLEGTVIGYELNDPHSFLFVKVIDQSGRIVKWEIEGGAGSGIVKAGLSQQFLSSNPTVTIKAFQQTNNSCLSSCKAIGQDFDFHR